VSAQYLFGKIPVSKFSDGSFLDVFATSPSFDELEHCRKADLLIIGKFFDIDLPSVLRIAEILKVLGDMLVERGVLPDPAAGVALGEVGATVGAARADAPAPGIECSVCVQAGMSTGDLRLTLHIREVESWNKELELEATHLRLKTLELERRQPAAAASPLLARQPSDPASGGFDVSRHIVLVPPFRDSEVDSYFNAFERIAALLRAEPDMPMKVLRRPMRMAWSMVSKAALSSRRIQMEH